MKQDISWPVVTSHARPHEDICVHVEALNTFECIVDRLQQREASLPKDRKTVCALNKIMSLFILEDRQ